MAMSEAEREALVRGFEALAAATAKQLPRNVRSQRTILRRKAAVDRETMFAAKMLLFDMRMMGAGLHVTDDGELWQMRRPLLGYERIAERARRLGAVQVCQRCHRAARQCNCERRWGLASELPLS